MGIRKVSAWLITINPNLRFEAEGPELEKAKQELEQVINEVCGPNGDNLKKYVIFRNSGEGWSQVRPQIDFESCVERGEINNQVHCHIMYRLRHETSIRLDYSEIKKEFARLLGRNVYFWTHVYGSAKENLKNYISKNRENIIKNEKRAGLVDSSGDEEDRLDTKAQNDVSSDEEEEETYEPLPSASYSAKSAAPKSKKGKEPAYEQPYNKSIDLPAIRSAQPVKAPKPKVKRPTHTRSQSVPNLPEKPPVEAPEPPKAEPPKPALRASTWSMFKPIAIK